MSDFADLSMIASSALPVAFTFLSKRLEAALERRRSGRLAQPEPQVPAELVGSLELPLRIDADQLEHHLPALEILALGLTRYERDPALITAEDAVLMEMLGRARSALEDIYGQHFTFKGETRARSGPLSHQDYDTVSGEVTGLEAQDAIRGSVTSTIRARNVEVGAKVVGMKAPVIEDRG